jgi:phosphoglycolate phosphatase
MIENTIYKAVIFDLDGTLLDTLDDLADSVNAVLLTHGYKTHGRESYRYFVGDGIINLILRALPDEAADELSAKSLLPEVDAEYNNRWHAKTAPYPGIKSLLTRLSSKGIKLAVLSNKPHIFTTQIVQHFFPETAFEMVFGARDGIPRKPDPAAAIDIAHRLALPPNSILYLGDTNTDMKTAVSAGMFAVGAAWGFRPVEELVEAGANSIIEQPGDLINLLGR